MSKTAKDRIWNVLQTLFVVATISFLIVLWHWEDAKYRAIYECEDQSKTVPVINWTTQVLKAPEWCDR